MTLNQAKILAVIAILVFSHGLFYNFGHTAAKSKCTSEKLDVAETTIETTGDNIEASNESAKANQIHSSGNKVVVAKATTDIANIPNIPLDSGNCSAGSLVRLQQQTYTKFPASLFVQ